MSPFYLNFLQLVGLLPAVVIAVGLQQTIDICKVVDSRLPGRISYPGNAGYANSQSAYYSGQERALSPGCIFRPNDTSDVSQFVKLVVAGGKKGSAGQSTPHFAIRSGGHTLFTGAANIDGGVTVDMRGMKSVVLSEDKKMASLGGGGIFSDIYPQVVPYNLTVMGGRVPGIAAGGFLTGGKSLSADILFPFAKGSLFPRWRELPVKETRFCLRQHLRL